MCILYTCMCIYIYMCVCILYGYGHIHTTITYIYMCVCDSWRNMWINYDEIINKHPKCIGSEKERGRERVRKRHACTGSLQGTDCVAGTWEWFPRWTTSRRCWSRCRTHNKSSWWRGTPQAFFGPISINVGKKMRTQWFRIVVLPSTIC